MAASSSNRWSRLTLFAAIATGVLLAVVPMISTESCEASSVAATTCSSSRSSLLEQEGAIVLIVLAAPALIAALPIVVRSPRTPMAAAIGLTVSVLVAIASIGIFLVPTAALSWIAATRSESSSDERPDTS